MKKENIIISFYVVYFGWLFTVAFLTPSVTILNYFTATVAVLYFVLLREKGDIVWFWISALIPLLVAATSFGNWQFSFDFNLLYYTPLWLPLAWGTTIVALRKFFILVTK